MFHVAAVTAVQHPALLVRAEPDTGTLRLFGELDMASAADLLTAAAERLHHDQSITVDLTDLMFIDAAGIGAIVTLANRCQKAQTHLTTTGASDRIAALLTIAGVGDLLTAGSWGTVTAITPALRQQAAPQPASIPTLPAGPSTTANERTG